MRDARSLWVLKLSNGPPPPPPPPTHAHTHTHIPHTKYALRDAVGVDNGRVTPRQGGTRMRTHTKLSRIMPRRTADVYLVALPCLALSVAIVHSLSSDARHDGSCITILCLIARAPRMGPTDLGPKRCAAVAACLPACLAARFRFADREALRQHKGQRAGSSDRRKT